MKRIVVPAILQIFCPLCGGYIRPISDTKSQCDRCFVIYG